MGLLAGVILFFKQDKSKPEKWLVFFAASAIFGLGMMCFCSERTGFTPLLAVKCALFSQKTAQLVHFSV